MSAEVLLNCDGICKSFSGVDVLKGINLVLRQGEILSIIGGNGAGKSTLMKIIMGVYKKDSGNLIVNGEVLENNTPSQALKKGIYLVPQEPLLFQNMTVLENVMLGLEGNEKDNHEKLEQLIKVLDWDIDISRMAITLSIAEQQLVEILKGLIREPSILILDEPTSSLTLNEIKSLFKMMKQLQEKNVGIIYITHRLNEVIEMSTNVVVLRDGKITIDGPISMFNEEKLVQGLLPEDAEVRHYKADRNEDFSNKESMLIVNNLTGNGFKDISFEIKAGEILGLAGVVGAGRTELAESIFGRDKISAGKVYILKRDITNLKTKEIIDYGLSYVPEDRFRNGIFKIRSIIENMSSASFSAMKGPNIDDSVENKFYNDFKERFKIVCKDQYQEIGDLSGGNQQKIVISRAVATMPRVLILDEPTRGVDAGAREDVYKIIEKMKAIGVAVLLISSDTEELVRLSDRVVSMYRGRINAEFKNDEIDYDNLTAAIFGIVKEK